MTDSPRALFVTDFDGTLYLGDHRIHPADREALERLGNEGILRAVATGRSLESYRHTASALELPVDYVIFSSGAGIVDGENGLVEAASALEPAQVHDILAVFEELGMDYMIHEPIPDNHRFYYRAKGERNTDFQRRCALYEEHCSPLPEDYARKPEPATQFIAILPPGVEGLPEVRRRLGDYSVVRTTSPLDGRSTWIEVFPRGISKSSGVARLCERHGIPREMVCAAGNDYNDLDLLQWAGWAFVPAGAPEELREAFRIIPDDGGGALSGALSLWLEQLLPRGTNGIG